MITNVTYTLTRVLIPGQAPAPPTKRVQKLPDGKLKSKSSISLLCSPIPHAVIFPSRSSLLSTSSTYTQFADHCQSRHRTAIAMGSSRASRRGRRSLNSVARSVHRHQLPCRPSSVLLARSARLHQKAMRRLLLLLDIFLSKQAARLIIVVL